jgi:hypothetical protein
MGACFSFTCGALGSRGGFALQNARPNQDLFIGVKNGDRKSDSPIVALPFYHAAATVDPVDRLLSRPETIKRHYGWATDSWSTPEFEFTIYSPFGEIVEPDKYHPSMSRVCLLPAVLAALTIDNSTGTETKTGIFAINFNQPGARLLPEQQGWRGKKRVGFGLGPTVAVQAMLESDRSIAPEEEPFVFMQSSPHDGAAADAPVHGLGTCPGIGFEVPPGKTQTLVLALGVYLDGVVTTGMEGRYYYTRHFSSLTDVLDQALRAWDAIKGGSGELDRSLLDSGLSADQQFLIAHSTRSYYANTQMLDVAGKPFWVVNSGDSGIMNPLDQAVDQVFWELKHNPWLVRNRLDNFVRSYSYYDQVKVAKRTDPGPPSAEPTTSISHEYDVVPGGISFCHDMGANNNFSPCGHSAYEMPHRVGRFSYMTQEGLCNWILIAASYVARTGDLHWLRQNMATVLSCVTSMVNRDHPVQERRDGIMCCDSARCGRGRETTTFDTLEAPLTQARDNLYLAVKCWAAYLGLELMFNNLQNFFANQAINDCVNRCADTIAVKLSDAGFIPAIFGRDKKDSAGGVTGGGATRTLAAIDPLAFPLYWATCDNAPLPATMTFGEKGYKQPTAALKKHMQTLLRDVERRNLFADGGLKLFSTSSHTWMSKVAIVQHVAREVLYLDDDPAIADLFRRADAAHVRWQTDGGGCAGCTDEFDGPQARAGRSSPRCVTTALWMK